MWYSIKVELMGKRQVSSLLLSKLEAYGFKSFAEPIEVHFEPGITAVVGPNGSGKSNITDAIRWALGEQSLRTLRGTKSEDIIFAGTSTRRALGVAEVSLTFDNTDGTLPLDFVEVIITRRLYRSGDSEYFINRTPCRLKDIYALLADSGIGRESMTVVGQNKIDEILNTKAEDRRSYFEEAAGISKYKQRKKEALRKLEDTKQNLLRLSDLTQEIEERLEPLGKSAAKTRQYQTLSQKLKATEIAYYVQRHEKAGQNEAALKDEYDLRREQELKAASALSLLEMSREKTSDFLAEQEQELQAKRQILREFEEQLRDAEAQAGILQERINQTQLNEVKAKDELKRHEQSLEQVILQKETALHRQSEIFHEQQKGQSLLDQYTAECQNERTMLSQLQAKIEAGKDELFTVMQEIVTLNNDSRQVDRDFQQLALHQSKSKAELENAEKSLQEVALKQQSLAKERESCHEMIKSLNIRLQKLESELDLLKKEQEKNQQHEKICQRRVHETAARLRVLHNLQQDYEGFGRPIRSLMKSQESWRNGILGPVAELIHVPKKYIVAIETALGGALQNLVTRDAETARKAIEYLKEKKLGRATFLPLTTIQGVHQREIEKTARKNPLCLGYASELIECDSSLNQVVQQLLGRCLVSGNLANALELSKLCHYQVKIVTLEGEVLYPGGSLAGGSQQSRRESSFLGRQAELEELKQQADEAEKMLAECLAQQKTLEEHLVRRKEMRQEESQKLSETIQLDHQLKIHQEQQQIDLRRIQQARDNAIYDLKRLEDQTDQLLKQQKATAVAHQGKQKVYEELQANVTKWQEEYKQGEEKQQRQNEQLTQLQIKSSQWVERLQQVEQELQHMNHEEQRILAEMDRVKQEEKSLREQLALAENHLTELQLIKQQRISQISELSEVKRKLEGTKLQGVGKLQILDKQIKEQRQKVQEWQLGLHDLELSLTRFQSELKYCVEQLQARFTLTIEQAMPYRLELAEGYLKDQMKSLQKELASLGPIHEGAVEEYENLKQRYEFLMNQYEDLIKAKEYLEKLVSNLDETMAEQFKLAFKQINEYFGDIFQQLFGGGKGQLVLQDPENLLETGVEIIIQPPGKKQQNLSLFSGGERAFTVIALIFAFLKYRPAPFCVVDEIDAPLDEANVQRFSDFLRQYAKNTQFIVVTHRKGTMEAAHVLHGVTMEESGISKLISVKLMEQAG